MVGEGDAFATVAGRPCVVMSTGMGGTKDSGLMPFAEAFAGAGLDVLLFDYRGFGESGGRERQVAWPPDHRRDLAEAVRFARGLEGIDPGRIVLWGWSWGSSHAIYQAVADPEPVAAVIAVGPEVDGFATLRHLVAQIGLSSLASLNARAARDLVAKARGLPPELIPLVGPPGTLAALTTEESEPGYTTIAGPTWRNEVAARVATAELGNRAISRADRIRCPILIQAGDRDSIAPIETARRLAWEAKGHSELREYPGGHWDYLLELRPRVIEDELHFLRRHLARKPGDAGTASPPGASAAAAPS